MNHTIQLTTEQFEALQSGQPITIEPPKPVIPIAKWEPIEGNCWVVNYCLSTSTGYYNKAPSNAVASGLTYKTKAQADSAAKQLRAYARQLAWLAENDDGWIADWSNEDQDKYHVYIAHNGSKVTIYSNYTNQSFGLIYMSQVNATKLAQLMNDGIVEF